MSAQGDLPWIEGKKTSMLRSERRVVRVMLVRGMEFRVGVGVFIPQLRFIALAEKNRRCDVRRRFF